MGRLLLTIGDMTKQKSLDAIVTITDSSLINGGGINEAINEVAGPKLKEECLSLNGCEPGQAKITRAYDLPNKYVIHTVGPVWNGGQDGESEVLASCYYECFELAKRKGIKSIAIPSFSTGLYQYPTDKEAEIAFTTLQEFVNENGSYFDLISWVFSDEKICSIYSSALHKIVDEAKRSREEVWNNLMV